MTDDLMATIRDALEFYTDPFAWKKKHDPDNDVQVPDFYSETSFGDTAGEALSALDAATQEPQPVMSAEEAIADILADDAAPISVAEAPVFLEGLAARGYAVVPVNAAQTQS